MAPSRSLKSKSHSQRPLRALLIFNAASGRPEESPQQLVQILAEMQDQHISPEVYTVRPDSDLETVVRRAIKSGIKLIVVAGGDGTVDSLVGALVGTDAVLGIIPTGTRNNVAFNLGIDGDITSSVALLRRGRRLKIDAGRVQCGHSQRWFLEAATIGLASDLYPVADDIQHGKLTQVGELLSRFIAAEPSRLRMDYDGRKPLITSALMVVVTNMPFLGPHFQISPTVSFRDGRLDVFAFSDMTKLNVVSYAMFSRFGLAADASIRHYRVRHAKIRSIPRMPVLADGIQLGEGSLSVHVQPRALTVIAGAALKGRSSATSK